MQLPRILTPTNAAEATLRKHNALTRFGLAVEHRAPIELRQPGRPWVTKVAEWLRYRAGELGLPYTPRRRR